MKEFSIIADATSDLSEVFQKEYNVRVLPAHVTLPGGEEMLYDLKWERFTREEFYQDLKKRPPEYSTSPANVSEFAAAFKEEILAGRDVLCFTISSGISGAYNFALSAKAEVEKEYPGAEIEVVDTLRFGPGFGLMTVYASMMRKEGKSMKEIAVWFEENKNRFHQAGWLDDLSFVARKGRITHSKAFFGTLAGVKPIGEFDYNGLTTVLGKVTGAKAAYELLLTYMEKTIEKPEEQIIFIAQTERLPQAEIYKKMIEEKFHPRAIYINDVFPPCGVNIGPGLMAAYYIGTPISKDLSAEKGIVAEALNGGKA